jgi:hypothetical protein
MGKNERGAKKDKNISTTGTVEGFYPVATAGVNEFETNNQKILGLNSILHQIFKSFFI